MKKQKLTIKETVKKRIELRHQNLVFLEKRNPKYIMNERDRQRTLTKNSINNGSFLNFDVGRVDIIDSSFVRNVDVDYDTVIIVASYNRYEYVTKLLNQLYSQETEYSYKVIVVNDGSDDIKYSGLSETYPELIYMENSQNNGKQGYWKTINVLLREAKKYNTNSILQIDDDFELCDEFLNKLLTLYYEKKSENNKIFCLSYHLYDKNHLTESRWNLRYWVDGGGLYDIEFIKSIDYALNEIPKTRWEHNRHLSTGVWLQISKRINEMKRIIYKTPVSYAKHLCGNDSKMWTGAKPKTDGLVTYNFINDIYENTK